MPFAFNQELWDIGRKIEDTTLPMINKEFDCDFERDENNIFDVLDFRDPEKKIIVEVKGRRIPHDKYTDTIITASKITKGLQEVDNGWKVFFVFVFSDKTFKYELLEDASFQCKYTGTNCIRHYLIPITDLTEINHDEEEIISEDNNIE